MKIFKEKGLKKCLVLSLVVFLVVLVVNPSVVKAANPEGADCDKGLVKCLFTAALASFANPGLGASLAAFCVNGYIFCLEFLQ